MSEIGASVIFPKPENQKETDLYNTLTTFVNDVIKILNRGILFSDNIDSREVTFTSNGVADVESSVSHSLGRVPNGYIVVSQNKAGSLYKGSTSWTTSAIYVKCNTASTEFKIIVY